MNYETIATLHWKSQVVSVCLCRIEMAASAMPMILYTTHPREVDLQSNREKCGQIY